MKPLRVLAVSHACVVDANQTLFRQIEQADGIELRMIAPKAWRTDLRGNLEFQKLEAFNSPIDTLQPVFSGQGTLHFYRGAARSVEQYRPDLIFLDEEPWSLCALQFARLARTWSSRLVFYTKENLHKWYPQPFRGIERRVFQRSSGAIAISGECKSVLQDKGYAGPVTIVPHGIEPEWFQPTDSTALRRKLGLSGVVVGYVGRLSQEKGVADLVAAVGRLRAGAPDLQFRVLIIGSGPDETRLRELVRNDALDAAFTFLPAAPHSEIAAYYSCIDVLVVPSRTTPRWKEQFGRVLVEAMACGSCVVGSDSGEIPTVIGDAGLVFPERNVDALTAALQRLLGDAALRRDLAIRGRSRALAQYSNAVVASQLIEAWRVAGTARS